MRRVFGLVSTVITLCMWGAASGATWYVNGKAPVSGDGRSWLFAFWDIQQGIDAASHGDTVIVAEDIYYENIHFDGKNIVLQSKDPENPAVVEQTIIDGNNSGSVVTFDGTEDDSCVLTGFTIRHGEADYGGGIYSGSVPFEFLRARIQNNLIVNNTAAIEGGGIYNCDGVINGNTIYGNMARDGGGLADCDATIRNNIIERNSASDQGGGLYLCGGGVVGGIATIEENTITLNSAQYGGGLSRCGRFVRDNTISSNVAEKDGGGLYWCDGMIQGNTIVLNSAQNGGGLSSVSGGTIEGNTISSNIAEVNGGGISNCDGKVLGNMISWNSAGERGGGLYGCDRTIQGNTVVFNSAQYGGGIYSGLNATIEGNSIASNTAEVDGGGLTRSAARVLYNDIVENQALAGSGGGIHYCSGKILGNTISRNSAGKDGGGLANCSGPILYNEIAGNKAPAGSGGGLSGCSGSIIGNVISSNSAGENGGGLSVTMLATIKSNLICVNSCPGEGGGIYSLGSSILNNTVIGNSAGKGGGIYASVDDKVYNCVVWENGATTDPQLYREQFCLLGECYEPDISYCCIQDWTQGGEENIAAYPGFVSPDGRDDNSDTYEDNDYRLSADSPCIDRGDNSLLPRPGLDLDGNFRIAFGKDSLTVDMGAYEYNSVPLEFREITPTVVWVDTGLRKGVRLTWNSHPDDSYFVWSRDTLSGGVWALRVTLPSQGEETSWVDVEDQGQTRFYRVEIKP